MSSNFEFIHPDWPAPAQVRALTTTRVGGFSAGAFASFNLGDHVGDDAEAVQRNRAQLREQFGIPEPSWLKQVHGTDVVEVSFGEAGHVADGGFTEMAGTVCAVLTADCLPVFLCDRAGSRVAVVHAGWRGLVNGVIEAGVLALRTPSDELLAWLGPAIGPEFYEVGDDVRNEFMAVDAEAESAFRARGQGKWLADMYALARQRLNAIGVESVHGGDRCTYREQELFFSYRRDGTTGRMASLIWIDPG
ncbi:MAG: peptidoglycan editing factor PgeF [Pseudomonadota bacterium]